MFLLISKFLKMRQIISTFSELYIFIQLVAIKWLLGFGYDHFLNKKCICLWL